MQPHQPPVPGPPAPAAPELPGASQLAAARARLATISDLPLGDHVAAYDAVHRLLQDALAGVQQISRVGSEGAGPDRVVSDPAGV